MNINFVFLSILYNVKKFVKSFVFIMFFTVFYKTLFPVTSDYIIV